MKRILALVLAVVMCAAMMVGCTGKKDDGNTLRIGSIGPITGDAAIYGQAVKNGCQIAVDEINAAGGINGIKIEFQFEDDANVSETSVNAYNKLMDWGMDVLVGTVTTNPCISVSAEVNKDRVFALTPSASSTDVTAGKDNMFQLCFTDPNQGTGSATYISANLADKKIGIIYRNDDAYSQGIRNTFVAEAKKQNLNVVYEGTFNKDTATDFNVQLTAAKAAGADLIFLPIYYQPASVIFAQADAMGYDPIFFGVDGMDGILTMKNFDIKLAEGVMVLTPFSADAEDERTQNFVKEYQKRHGETPNQFAADGYDCIYAIKAAYEKAGANKDMSTEELCDALVKAMKEISFDGLTGKAMTWNDKGEVNKMPTAVVIKDGKYISASK
ncbi:MAG: ABC transporter substrate-binding protein [Ruminococcaceae bacterium]|nr:ABC transporter substrate-binding protein [Oscillospiraceae bacterium]